MKILILTQYFAPEFSPITESLVHELDSRGHEVKVLTGFPNYPAGKIFPGYRQTWRFREVIGNIEIRRVPLYMDHSQRAWARILNYLSFAVSSATARNFAKNADIIYVYATQMTPAFGPWLWSFSGGAPYVLHVQDLWPDSITGSSITGKGRLGRVIEALLNPWLSSAYRRASAVIGIAPTMVRTLISRGIEENQVHLVYNWSGNTLEPRPLKKEAKVRPYTHLIYAGNVGDMQDLDTVVRAAANTASDGIRLTIVGEGAAKSRLRILAKNLDATNVRFRDPVDASEMNSIYNDADFGLVTLKDLPAFRGTIPSKFQAQLRHGLPVLTTVLGDVQKVCIDYKVGFTALPESTAEMERMFREAASSSDAERAEMSRSALNLSSEIFSQRSAVDALESILQQVVKESEKK